MKVQAGQYGYLKQQKMKIVLKVILCVEIGLLMFGIGILANKGNTKNLGTVLAILMAMPAAKEITEMVVIFPFRDVEKSRYDVVKAKCPEQATCMTGLVITSEKKVMNLDFLVEWEGNVVGLAGTGQPDISYVNDYLTKGVRNWGFDYRVKIFAEEKAFLNAIDSMKSVKVSDIEKEHVISYLKSLIVK